MKTKSLLLISLLFTGMIFVQAGPVDVHQARKAAENFLTRTYIDHIPGDRDAGWKLDRPFIYAHDALPVFYAFNTDPGFILISAEDAYVPVIGYALEGSFDLEGSPDHYRGFIQNYIDQIVYIQENELAAEASVKAQWMDLLDEERYNSNGNTKERNVEPLLLCKWDQGSPFNALCPEDPAGPGGHVYVGCVATAMAQIMYYWRYPESGTGSHCYYASGYGQQCANFGNTYYQWNGMNNGIDNHNVYPNAELQYHCAVSVDMMFSPNGSGSYSFMVPESLGQYWKYNDAEYLQKSDYSYNDWVAILKDEIDAGHPLYYSGYNQNWEGHAFVCDGYQGENFHFNFGWSGSANGYYTLYDVYGFSVSQACVRYFYPTDTDYPYHAGGQTVLTARSGSFSDGSGPVENYLNQQDASWLISPPLDEDSVINISLSFYQFDLAEGDTLKIYDGATTDGPMLGAFSGNETPGNITSNGPEMFLAFHSNSNGTAAGWYTEYSANSAIYCTGVNELTEAEGIVSDGSGSYTYHSNSYCIWKIIPPIADKITLTFDQFDTEAGIDKLTVFDGNSKIAELSGSEIPGPLTATSGSMMLIWMSNANNNFQGWNAHYEGETVGIDEAEAVSKLEAYPNPADNELVITYSAESNQNISLRMLSLTGQVFYHSTSAAGAGNYLSVINVEDIPAGFYLLELQSGEARQVKKIAVR